MNRKLVVVADEVFRPVLRDSSNHFVSLSISERINEKFTRSPEDVIRNHIDGPSGPEAILVILPFRSRDSVRFKGPCVEGVPVGIVYADEPSDLTQWLHSVKGATKPPPAFGVMSMWKPFYLKWARKFGRAFKEGYGSSGIKVHDWCADKVLSEELCIKLSKGLGLGFYTGHGRSRGWSGYRGLRWRHIEAVALERPVSSVISLTCDNLKFDRKRTLPFGVQWVLSGRCCSFFAAADKVHIHPLIHIANVMIRVFAEGSCRTIGDFMRQTDQEVRRTQNGAVVDSWKLFRLIGNPLQRFA